ncbi:hypothetical protein GCM10027594_09630 [Hymenobacter agri]
MNPTNFLALVGCCFVLDACSPPTPTTAEQTSAAVDSYETGPLTLQVPKTWRPVDVSKLNSLNGVPQAYGFENATATDVAYGENFFIRYTPYGQVMSLRQWSDTLVATLQRRYGRVRVVMAHDTTVNRLSIRILDYELPMQTPVMRSTAVFIQQDSLLAQMEFSALNPSTREYPQVSDVFGDIITSLAPK